MLARTVVLTAATASCVSSVVTLIVALAVLPPMIHATPDPQATQPLVRAERFELMDAAGRVRATLSTERQGVGLALRDEADVQRVALLLDADALNGLFVVDPATRGGAFIGGSGGDPRSFAVRLTNAQGQGALMRAGTEGVGFIATDVGNRPRARMALSEVGVTAIEVGNDLLDSGTPRAALAQAPGAVPHLGIIDESGKPIWQAP